MKTKLPSKTLVRNYLGTWAQWRRRVALTPMLMLLPSLLTAQTPDPRPNPLYPMDAIAVLGGTARFTNLVATFYPPLRYQWLHEGTNLPSATNATLIISNVTLADAGGYMAWITNSLDGYSNSRTALLTLDLTDPSITEPSQPMDTNVAVGATVSFRVYASSTNPPITYQWQREQDVLPGATNSVLVLTNVAVTDAGGYKATVWNAGGYSNQSRTAMLTVDPIDPKIIITNHPADTNVSCGVTVRFLVYASTASQPLTYQWLHDGTNLPGATNALLQIVNVTVAHAGSYVAWVTNAIGGVTNSRTALLTVDPTFTQVAAGHLTTDTVGAWNAAWVDYDGDGHLDVSVAPGGDRLTPTPLYHNEGNGTFRKITTNVIGTTSVQTYSHVWADYDNDGRLDLFVPNTWGGGMNDMLFRNLGIGSFTRITTGHPVIDAADSILGAWGDYDRDGFLDLFVATSGCPGQNDILYRSNGDGTFRKMTAAEAGPLISDLAVADIATWVDVDNDGWPELSRNNATACINAQWTNELWHLGSDRKFFLMEIGEMKRDKGAYTAITWADYDNDGFLDALVTQQKGPLELYRNLAGQGFTNVTASTFPTSLTNCLGYWAGDHDNDGWQDIAIAYWSTPPLDPAIFRNNGGATFTRQNLGSLTSGMGWPVWGDYNNDGFLDALVIYGVNLRNSLFRHNGNTNHWLKVKLDGLASNRDGIGAKVRVHASIRGTNFWQMREISGQGIGFDNGLLAHFGLGDATNVTTLRIEWPSGIVQELTNVAANQFLTVVENQGYLGTAPSFTGATKNASGVQLTFTEPDAPARYILEGSTNLVNWTKLLARTSAGVTTNYTDWRATNYARCFYRLQVP